MLPKYGVNKVLIPLLGERALIQFEAVLVLILLKAMLVKILYTVVLVQMIFSLQINLIMEQILQQVNTILFMHLQQLPMK